MKEDVTGHPHWFVEEMTVDKKGRVKVDWRNDKLYVVYPSCKTCEHEKCRERWSYLFEMDGFDANEIAKECEEYMPVDDWEREEEKTPTISK